jgi:hypothetical protein
MRRNRSSVVLDEPLASSQADQLPIDRERSSGFVLKPVDVPAALSALDSFLEEGQDEAEQRETFEYLKQALDETRAAQGYQCWVTCQSPPP